MMMASSAASSLLSKPSTSTRCKVEELLQDSARLRRAADHMGASQSKLCDPDAADIRLASALASLRVAHWLERLCGTDDDSTRPKDEMRRCRAVYLDASTQFRASACIFHGCQRPLLATLAYKGSELCLRRATVCSHRAPPGRTAESRDHSGTAANHARWAGFCLRDAMRAATAAEMKSKDGALVRVTRTVNSN